MVGAFKMGIHFLKEKRYILSSGMDKFQAELNILDIMKLNIIMHLILIQNFKNYLYAIV
jgi:hypothetical protein